MKAMARQPQPPSPTPPRRTPGATGRDTLQSQPGPLFYGIVSLVAFLIGLAILSAMLWNAQLLAAFGLTGNYYYAVLLALGLAAAAFLFGVLQSYARFNGRNGWGVLELGGPIVGSALVVLGGFYLVPNPLPFAVTVFVHGEGGIHDLLPKDSGEVVMELGGKVQRQQIGPNGTADFKDIAPSHRGEAAQLWFESDQFESVHPEQKYALKGDIQLEVRKKGGKISGRVQDENGKLLSGVKIQVAGLSTTTDSAGHFEVFIPGDRLQQELDLDAVASGYSSSHLKVVPNGNDVVIPLTPAR